MREVKALLLECGRPVKDEESGDDWRDYDWDHWGNGCPGWQETGQSEVVESSFRGISLMTLTHCRCECRMHPHVTLGLEFYRALHRA
ncbi:Hypothetical Protein OBI_RACECAR_270 [Arthrobacter phage Racecar]|nr:hypothetical protein PBI_RACECAR_62 [Arthrobacter phage Racecar]